MQKTASLEDFTAQEIKEQSLSSLSHPFNRDKNSSDQKLHVMAVQGLDEEMVTQRPGPNRSV